MGRQNAHVTAPCLQKHPPRSHLFSDLSDFKTHYDCETLVGLKHTQISDRIPYIRFWLPSFGLIFLQEKHFSVAICNCIVCLNKLFPREEWYLTKGEITWRDTQSFRIPKSLQRWYGAAWGDQHHHLAIFYTLFWHQQLDGHTDFFVSIPPPSREIEINPVQLRVQ